MKKQSTKTVTVESLALVSMIQHSVSHKYEAIHGLLLGVVTGDCILVKNAVAVCHGTPTRPLVEIAIGLVQTKTDEAIVGWYTAPVLLNDSKPEPVALRMAANLETEEFEPALIVLSNSSLAACFKGERKHVDILQAFGKDNLGDQWVRPLECTVEDSSSAIEQLKKEKDSSKTTYDLVDHLEGDVSTPWFTT